MDGQQGSGGPWGSAPTPAQSRGAAAVAQTLSYVSGLAGIVAGGLAFNEGQRGLAVVVWVLSFAAGATLMLISILVRMVAESLRRQASMEVDMARLARDQLALREGRSGYDPGTR